VHFQMVGHCGRGANSVVYRSVGSVGDLVPPRADAATARDSRQRVAAFGLRGGCLPSALLLEYIAEANDLAGGPRFYNSLTTNCTTQVFHMVRAVQPGLPLDYRILLAGYVPQFVYDRGAMAAGIPFEVLRDRSHIRGKAASTDPDFSRVIRQGVPAPP
jgi:hypothetical protein